jgi:hypothetical protein
LFDSDVEIFFMGFKDSGGTATNGGSGVDKSNKCMKRRYFIGNWKK